MEIEELDGRKGGKKNKQNKTKKNYCYFYSINNKGMEEKKTFPVVDSIFFLDFCLVFLARRGRTDSGEEEDVSIVLLLSVRRPTHVTQRAYTIFAGPATHSPRQSLSSFSFLCMCVSRRRPTETPLFCSYVPKNGGLFSLVRRLCISST